MSNYNKSRREWLEALSATGSTRFDVAACEAVVAETGRSCIPLWFRANSCEFKASRGQWDISSFVNGSEPTPAPVAAAPAPAAPAAPAPVAPVMQMAGAAPLHRCMPSVLQAASSSAREPWKPHPGDGIS